jgi:8-oxo-dGTP pyrophosphatase MutT (NUDIX family)
MAPRRAIVSALKAIPAGSGRFAPVNSGGMGRISPAMWEQYAQNSYLQAYGKFLPRPPEIFSDGAFAPAPPIIPTPVDQPPPGGSYPGPRWWQYRQAWNLPTPPGTEGLKLASFDQLRTLSQKYSVARACIELRLEEIRGLEWSVALTTNAAKAYRGDSGTMRELGEKIAGFTKFFRRPDPDFWNFDSFMNALLEEIFVYDALSVIFRPKLGAYLSGMSGKGLMGSDLDSLNLVSGPTIRPLVDLQGGHPRPPAPAYQQFLYGVPRSDYMTIAMGTDIDDAGLAGAEVNEFNADIMLYAPYWPTRESPYGFPPVERALLPIISGIQKQEYQLDYFTEGSVPAVYISPGDNSITPTQIAELQSALNAIAGDVAYHQKVVVLPPGSKVEPQRAVDLSDGFDILVQTQVCMAFDVQPIELGILPNIGGASAGAEGGATASGVRFASQESRDLKSRKSTKPLLKFICDIFNYVIQDVCGEKDLQFQFEGLVDDEDKQAITELGVEQIQNGISSIDEIRERLDLPPWGMPETSEPIVITQQGPVPFSMAPQLLQAQLMGNGQANDNSKLPSARRGTGGTKPNGSHPAPLAPARPNALTPSHAAAEAQVSRPVRGQSGGSPSRSPVAGSRKRGEARSPTQGRLRNKAIESELEALGRHLRKGREITTWVPVNITNRELRMIAEDVAKGVLIDVAVARAASTALISEEILAKEEQQWPGWQHDVALVGEYRGMISQAFQDTEIQGRKLRKEAAAGQMFVSAGTLHDLVSGIAKDVFISTMTPLWTKAWDLGYSSASELLGKSGAAGHEALQNFLDTEGTHWLEQIARTGLGNSDARSEIIARTEVARAMNAAAIQCYRDNGITHKHLLVSPENCCDICMAAKEEGDIPLDAIFPGGGLGGPFHPQCRCIPAPSGIAVQPPAAHVSKSAREDHSRLAWLLLRAQDEDGKYRFLLQQRSEGTWGMPGGTPHVGEDPWDAAVRETTEEIGDLPPLKIARTFHHVEEDGKTQAYLWLVDVPYFQPKLNGDTPEETQGAAWFRKKEIGNLDLVDKFREDWDHSVHLKDNVTKAIRSTENGELLEEDPRYGAGTGSNWPYPRHADGSPALDGPDGRPVPQNNRPGGGYIEGEMGAIEPPFIQDDMSDEEHAVLYPNGTEENFPRRRTRNRGPKKLPHGPDGQWPHTTTTKPGPGAQGVPGG